MRATALAGILFLACAVAGCHVDQELNPSGPGAGASQVIKFENITGSILLIRIPDAKQDFELGGNQSRTVEVYSEDGITTFFVEIIRGNQDIATAARWSGFVDVGKRVTIQHISRVYVE